MNSSVSSLLLSSYHFFQVLISSFSFKFSLNSSWWQSTHSAKIEWLVILYAISNLQYVYSFMVSRAVSWQQLGASDFPWLLWMWPLPTFIGKWKKKQNQKEFPSCFIPCLLVVFTHKRELSLSGISLLLLKDFHVLWVMYHSKQKDWTLKCLKCLLQGDKNNWKF